MPRLLALAFLLGSALTAHARCSATVVTGPVKVRPYAALPATGGGPLLCARNEYCSFQVVVTAADEDCRGVKVEVGALSQSPRATIPPRNVTVYRQAFLHVFYPSAEGGPTGEWPDALIPAVDPEYGEPRNAFPVDLSRISPAYKKYAQRAGRSLTRGRGDGVAVTGGSYSGAAERRYTVQIVRPGPLGQARFRWWCEPGGAKSAELPVTSDSVELDSGVRLAFHGLGYANDFLAGDEFWLYAGPARHLPVWVDVLIPEDAAPGVYRGQVRVTIAGQVPLALPLVIEVLPVSLPSTPSLATTFGFSWTGVLKAHFLPPTDKNVIAVGHAYAHAALRNGITLAISDGLKPEYEFNPDGSVKRADYSQFDAALAPLLDGKGTPRGARWTSLGLSGFRELNDRQLVSAVRHLAGHARQRGWFDRLFDYSFDEPNSPADFAALMRRARLVREADPAIPRLATTTLRADLYGLVTRWCPVVNLLAAPEPSLLDWLRGRVPPSREDYEPRLRAGDSLWWYQSCLSHGCTGKAPPENWPSYVVDSSAVANRAFGLLSVSYRVSGILYWDTVFSHHFDPSLRGRHDPWEAQLHFGGNGEGSLFYPGRPEQLGGKRHFAVESLRLKMIRDSLVDAELALLLERRGDGAFVRREIAAVAPTASTWRDDPKAWVAVRERLARRLAQPER